MTDIGPREVNASRGAKQFVIETEVEGTWVIIRAIKRWATDAGTSRTPVSCGTDISIVTGGGVVGCHTPDRWVTDVIGANVSIVTTNCRSPLTNAILTGIGLGAGVAITARGPVCRFGIRRTIRT